MYTFVFVLADTVTRESPRAAANSLLPKKLHSRMAEQAGKSARTTHHRQWPRPSEGPEESSLPSEAGGGTSEQSVTDQGNPLQCLPGRITARRACLAIAASETGSPLSQALFRRGMLQL